MATDEELFEHWLDGGEVDKHTVNRWHHDKAIKGRFEAALYLRQQAQCLEQQPVPNWDAGATFQHQRESRRWFEWLTISPTLSMAMSITAILMVLFRVQLVVNEDGLLLTFGGNSSQKMSQMMDDKIDQFGRDQQLLMANYIDDIQQQQKQDVTQLASYLMQSNREERREELSELVNYLNTQRKDDMSLQRQRIDNIFYQFSAKNNEIAFQPVNYETVSKQSTKKEEK